MLKSTRYRAVVLTRCHRKIEYGYSTRHYQPNCIAIEDSMEVTKEVKELLDERWAAFLADPSSALTIEEFRKKMRAQIEIQLS